MNDKSNFTPKEIGQIVTAYTGVMCSTFPDFHEYAERILGRPIFTHEFGEGIGSTY